MPLCRRCHPSQCTSTWTWGNFPSSFKPCWHLFLWFFLPRKKDFQMKPTREICLKLSKGGGIPGKLRTWKAFKYIYHFHFRFNLSPFWNVVLWYMFHISYFSHSKRRGLWYFLFPLTQGKIFHICLQAFDFIWVFSFDAGMYKASSWTFGTKKSHDTLIYLSAIFLFVKCIK